MMCRETSALRMGNSGCQGLKKKWLEGYSTHVRWEKGHGVASGPVIAVDGLLVCSVNLIRSTNNDTQLRVRQDCCED